MTTPVRVRFAPSPTGTMHIGNLRTALLNYLFAAQKKGTFILRIEDTDPERNFDIGAQQIIADLKWMGLMYQEGPEVGGPYAPYFQSERLPIYQEKLKELEHKKLVYPCFCSPEELEKKRQRQQALKLPPRYDRECLKLSAQDVARHLEQKLPFIWRFKLDHEKTISIQDIAHGTVTFELKNFSDFPLTRSDGTFTFMFSNFVDDMVMKITEVFRGEDHLSNTAGQAALYLAFNAPLPIFYHMPILCNIDGKKLSKRDFGFSLHDLKKAGYLPQAINNYLAIIGSSYPEEIMDLTTLASTISFEHKTSSNKIKYDVEKLRWVNHQWIQRLSAQELFEYVMPFLRAAYPKAAIAEKTISPILQLLKTDFYQLADAVAALKFYFESPSISNVEIEACIPADYNAPLKQIINAHLDKMNDPDGFAEAIKTDAKKRNVPLKQLFWFMRLALMGQVNGPSIHELLAILGAQESKKRLEKTTKLL